MSQMFAEDEKLTPSELAELVHDPKLAWIDGGMVGPI